ncbi:hypothetical protein B0H14DRAFT_2671119, partial [Mycena olivaceomarginata]
EVTTTTLSICSHHPRFTFARGAFKATAVSQDTPTLMSSYIEFDSASTERLNMSWLAQAHASMGSATQERGQSYGLVDTLGCVLMFNRQFNHLLHPEGIPYEVHLTVCGITLHHRGSWVSVESPHTDCFYCECDYLGIPRLLAGSFHAANFWDDYHYAAISEFRCAKGIDMDSYELAGQLGLPVVQMIPSCR